MGRFLRRKQVTETPSGDGVWQVPARFNFTRDVVEVFAADPLRPALTFVDRDGVIDRRTFAEVAAEANRWAALLRARGLVPGDRLLVLVGKTPAWHAVLLGALKAGLVTVPCSELLRARDLAFRAQHSGARLVVADRERAPELARMDVPVEAVLVEDVAAELRAFSVVQPTHDTAAADSAFILYTSGTTKDPKGATHTHAYTWAKRLQAEHWLDVRPDDLVWCTAGTGWAKSIWNVLLGPWSHGAEIVIHEDGFDPAQRFDLLHRLGVTVLCQAPTEYRLMAKLPSLQRFDLSRLRHAVSAGEPLNPEVIKAFRDAFGLTVYDGYGQTENTLLVANLPGTEIRPGSMGLPTPGHDVAVIDDEGNEQPEGAEGDLALRGRPPSLFSGYWNAPDETNAVFRGEWYVTGDRATRDEDGYLWFTGRADDVILSSAYRIGPFEVESALLEHPAVAESAVVGKPDADRGELVKAFVVLRVGSEPSDALAGELQAHVKSVTAPYKYPREIEFVTELPKTASGKIRRIELRERERERARAGRAADIPAVELAERALPDDAAGAEAESSRSEARLAEETESRREAAERAGIEAARSRKKARAAEAAELAAVEAAARAERRADLERRTADALAAEQAQRDEEAQQAEAAERDRVAAEVRLAAAQAQLAAEQARREGEQAQLAEQEARRRQQEEEARAAAEQRRLADVEGRSAAEEREREAERLRKQEAERPQDEERKRPRRPPATVPEPGDEMTHEGRLNPALISRLRAYGRREEPSVPEGTDAPEVAEGSDPPAD